MMTKLISDIVNKPNVYSWSAKVDFEVNSAGGFYDFSSSAPHRLEWSQKLILTLERRTIHPDLEASGTSGYRLIVDATQTAAEAEGLGKRLACALLKFAIDRQWGLRLSWQDTPLPCRVVDRTASRGIECQAFGSTREEIALTTFTQALEEAFPKMGEVPYRLLLSMELFASARFQTDNRAQLVMMVSALEAISEQRDISDEIGDLVPALICLVEEKQIADQSLKASILGTIRDMKRESSRRAVKRKLREASLSKEEIDFVEDAYSTRSKVVHEGLRVPELNIMIGRLDGIIRQIYTYEIDAL